MFSSSLEVILTVAYQEATSRRHTHLTLEHLLYSMTHDSEGEKILLACGGELPKIRQALDEFLQNSLEQYHRSNQEEPKQTLAFRRVLQTAVLHVQSAGRNEVEEGDVLAAILQQPKTYAAQLLELHGISRLDVLNYISHGISKVSVTSNNEEVKNSHDVVSAGTDEKGSVTSRAPLETYTTNLTKQAQEGKLDPLIGRTEELQRTLEILCRRRKNNPVFVGDAGVGKTALAEGLAIQLLRDDTPTPLKGAEVFTLDTAALLAGTRFRGDFEERFKAVLQLLGERHQPILFIDEIHSMVGAGVTTGGTLDLAALIKPILTSGTIKVVGSTTFEDYKHVEKDRALARRLQKVAVNEPSIEETIEILKGLSSHYGVHHDVEYTAAALETAARLASRHLRDYRLPDSAIDVLDEAGAVLRLQKAGASNSNTGSKVISSAPKKTLTVGPEEIEHVVARMARIPKKQTSSSDKERLRTLEESLQRVVFGQNEPVRTVVAAIKRSRAGLGIPDRPSGCFLFTGPTGVGKTELAKQLALHLGSEFIRYDMSEYMEKHAVARLIGAPPGYVGFDQGGLLVDAVRTHPYSVVLLDEIEKAHGDVFNILLQVMDHATLTDNNGRKADFRQVILIMTSNAGSREMSTGNIGFTDERPQVAKSHSKAAIERIFSPEFRNRLDAIVSFDTLTASVMETIVEKFILQLESQLAERRVAINLELEAKTWLAKKGYDPVFGARPMARVIQNTIRDPLTDEILFGHLENGGTVQIALDPGKGSLVFTFEATHTVKDEPSTNETNTEACVLDQVRSTAQSTSTEDEVE